MREKKARNAKARIEENKGAHKASSRERDKGLALLQQERARAATIRGISSLPNGS